MSGAATKTLSIHAWGGSKLPNEDNKILNLLNRGSPKYEVIHHFLIRVVYKAATISYKNVQYIYALP